MSSSSLSFPPPPTMSYTFSEPLSSKIKLNETTSAGGTLPNLRIPSGQTTFSERGSLATLWYQVTPKPKIWSCCLLSQKDRAGSIQSQPSMCPLPPYGPFCEFGTFYPLDLSHILPSE